MKFKIGDKLICVSGNVYTLSKISTNQFIFSPSHIVAPQMIRSKMVFSSGRLNRGYKIISAEKKQSGFSKIL